MASSFFSAFVQGIAIRFKAIVHKAIVHQGIGAGSPKGPKCASPGDFLHIHTTRTSKLCNPKKPVPKLLGV